MEDKIKEILKEMSLDDKVALCSGADCWHTKAMPQYDIPAMMLCDGPHGLRKQEGAGDMLGVNESVPATSFPTASLSACSFDTELLNRMGTAIGEEALANGVDVVLGPGLCIKRNPLCGRNFEYFSEDPYLSGKLAGAYVQGMQATGASACLKHFACNNQETKRFNSDSVIDERTLREIYLTGFEIAVREGQPRTVMCAYNKINGTYCSSNKMLLTDILRNEWGFKGMVVTDWGAMHNRLEAFNAGCDLNMPGGSAFGEKAAVRGGVSVELIDQAAGRIIKQGLMAESSRKSLDFDKDAHHDLARKVAESSIVLLKNDDGILPLKDGDKVALIGFMAETPRYQGAGSSHINPTGITCIKDCLPHQSYVAGYDENGKTSETLIKEATEAATSADKVVMVAGLPGSYESEGFDRDDMKMPAGILHLINEVTKVNHNVIVVLCTGSAVELPFEEDVKAVLYAGLSGQAGGEAIAEILTGKVNPSGKLAETWPVRYEDCPSSAYYGKDFKDAQYREGVLVGYRYYDKAGVNVRYPFGWGLSYTTFEYSNLRVESGELTDLRVESGTLTDPVSQCCQYTALVDITNTGKVAGSESVLLFIRPPQDGIYRPMREIKRFEKIYLKAGETKTVHFTLDDRCFAVWDTDTHGWVVPSGTYGIEIGPWEQKIDIDGVQMSVPKWQQGSWYERPNGAPSQGDWERLLGHKYEPKTPVKGQFTMENTVLEMRDKSFIMKMMFKGVESAVAKGFGGVKDYNNPDFKMMMAAAADCSLTSSQINGQMKDGIMQGMVTMTNGHFIKGLIKMIRGDSET